MKWSRFDEVPVDSFSRFVLLVFFVCVFNLFVGCGAEVSLLHAAFTDCEQLRPMFWRRHNFRALLSKDGEKKKKRMTETAGGGGEKGSNKDASEWERNAYSI